MKLLKITTLLFFAASTFINASVPSCKRARRMTDYELVVHEAVCRLARNLAELKAIQSNPFYPNNEELSKSICHAEARYKLGCWMMTKE